jgi:hypothetical protein
MMHMMPKNTKNTALVQNQEDIKGIRDQAVLGSVMFVEMTSITSTTEEASFEESSSVALHNSTGASLSSHKTQTGRIEEDHGAHARPVPEPEDLSKYGYGDAVPHDASKYGYKDPDSYSCCARPSSSLRHHHDDDGRQMLSRAPAGPRRSSMKNGCRNRRASIGACAGDTVEVQLPDSNGGRRTVKRRYSITFNAKATVRYMPQVKEITDEPEKLWFQRHEFERIQRKALAIVKSADEHSLNNSPRSACSGDGETRVVCTRGLEKYMKSQREVVSARRVNAWDSVLDEQDFQIEEGAYYNDHGIANPYTSTTMEPRKEANDRGVQDAIEAEKYLRSTRRRYRRMSSTM